MSENMEKLRDLLCDRAVFGLEDEETKQLEELTEGADVSMDALSLELAAAAVAVAGVKIEPMPAHLEAKLLKVADDHFAAERGAAAVESGIHGQPTQTFKFEPKPRSSFLNWFGWAAAAAACIALVGTLFYNQNRISELQAKVDQLTPKPVVEQSLAQKRDRLKSQASDIALAEWTKGNVKETEGVTGEVVWSDSEQEGYMTFRGLPVNDPNKEVYQLWIFEQADLEPHPKDGGVFSVSSEGEVIIPINAKLKTTDPKAFAITIERPGGVVVSSREKIAVLGPVKSTST